MRRRTPGRLGEIATAALAVFSRQGFQLTLMSDVARAAGLAAGTLYLYVESKEALLELALECAETGHARERPLPVRGQGLAKIASGLRDRLAERADWRILRAALTRRRVGDVDAEIREIATELFDLIAGARRLIWLLDRCAGELAEFAAVYHDRVKGAYMRDLTAYVWKRQSTGHVSSDLDPVAGARAIMEMIVWMAAHRHRDAMPPAIDDAAGREAVVTLAAKALR